MTFTRPTLNLDLNASAIAQALGSERVCLARASADHAKPAELWLSDWIAYRLAYKERCELNATAALSSTPSGIDEGESAFSTRAQNLLPLALANQVSFVIENRRWGAAIAISPLGFDMSHLTSEHDDRDNHTPFFNFISTITLQLLKGITPQQPLLSALAMLRAGFIWDRPFQRIIDRDFDSNFELELLALLESEALTRDIPSSSKIPLPSARL